MKTSSPKLVMVVCCLCVLSGLLAQSCTDQRGVSWGKLEPGSVGSSASGESMVWDLRGERLLLLKSGEGGFLNHVWSLREPNREWVELADVSGSPPSRSGYAVACDERTGRIILFGGRSETGYLNDTWIFDPDTRAWAEAKSEGATPSSREGHAMVFDPSSGTLLLFGGGRTEAHYQKSNDTWRYDPQTNTWTDIEVSTCPSPRMWHAMVYDPNASSVIMFGGVGVGEYGAVLHDTWSLTSDEWRRLEPTGIVPSSRSQHAMAYDGSNRVVVLFGGLGSTNRSLDDTWIYDSPANAWQELKASGATPSPRSGHSMVSAPAWNQVLLFGGHNYGGDLPAFDPSQLTHFNDLWVCEPESD